MKIVGGGSTRSYGYADEMPHQTGAEPQWQESVYLFWHDAKQNISGVHRIGHEPHFEGGKSVIWTYILTPEKTYTNVSMHPLGASRAAANQLEAGPNNRYEFDGKTHWIFGDAEFKANLVFDDFHGPIDVFPPTAGTVADDVAKNHLEASGRVTGTMELGGRKVVIDAVGHRDHSWGVRKWHMMLTHRWVGGIIDGKDGFVALSIVTSDGSYHTSGYMVRGEEITYAKDVDILVYLEADGVSHRGGVITMTMNTGEVHKIEAEKIGPGALCFHHENAFVPSVCRVKCGDRTGICDFEITNNSQRGFERPKVLTSTIGVNGLANRT